MHFLKNIRIFLDLKPIILLLIKFGDENILNGSSQEYFKELE